MVLQTFGWFILFLPLMFILYNIPLSLLVSAYSKLRYGKVVAFPRMPCSFVIIAMVITIVVAGAIPQMVNVDPAPVTYAGILRAIVYGIFNY